MFVCVKATNAIEAGAKAVLISNNAPGVFNGTLGALSAARSPWWAFPKRMALSSVRRPPP